MAIQEMAIQEQAAMPHHAVCLGLGALALGLSGQMHGAVFLNARGEVIRSAPLWNDQRTGAVVDEIEASIPREQLIARTGNRAVTGFQWPKLLWHVGSVSLGTSGVLFAPLDTPTPDPQGHVHLFAHADSGYHLLGVTLACAGALQWFRDALAPEPAFAALLVMPAAGLFPDSKR